jgi:glycosyltransferase involved in cell wall biosynthesis
MNRFGIIISHGAKSGGSFQWTKNILESLNNFATNKDILVTAFILNKEDFENVFNNYDNIKMIKVHPILKRVQNFIDGLYYRFPRHLYIYKLFSPLNILSRFFKIEMMIFPTIMSVCLYRNKFTFMFCDLSHKYYPDFEEIGGSYGINTRERIFSKGCANATTIIVESEELKKDVAKFYLVPKDKISVLYQTISTSLLLLNKEAETSLDLPLKYIFYPAQLWEHKNHNNLLRALKIIHRNDPQISLVLTGFSKSGDQKIFELVSELDLNRYVHYLGYVKDNQIIELYKNAFALVMPTYFGPTNIPTLEAFFYGCPAVISDLPGVREQAQNAAVYFNPDDPEDIARKLQLLNDREFRNKMIKEGYRRSKELSFDQYYNKTFQNILYKTLNL